MIEPYCCLCAEGRGLQVHHVDWNHKNNARENRVFLCQSCHSKVHQLGIKVREHLRPGLVEDAWYTMNRRKVLWG